jgi:hypothetical protein
VIGINFTNPITYKDSGLTAVFACIGGVKAGDEVKNYTPRMVTVGAYQNVTREATAEDVAIAGWPLERQK